MCRAGIIVGIIIVDHVIVTRRDSFSFVAAGIMPIDDDDSIVAG
jgi:DNA repair protein RadC